MKAIILAAGQGTRLKKYTEGLPKGMLKVNGKSIIQHQIELYKQAGINDIVIIKGFAAHQIKFDGIKYYTNIDYETTNMVASLMCAKEEFNDGIIISYADILFEEQMLRDLIDVKEDICVAVDDNWKRYWEERYGVVDYDTESLVIDENNHIISLGLSNPALSEISARYIGLLKFSKKGINIAKDLFFSNCLEYSDKPWQQSGKSIQQAYMTDLLNALIVDNIITAVHYNNGWIEFDTNEDYEKILKLIEIEKIKIGYYRF